MSHTEWRANEAKRLRVDDGTESYGSMGSDVTMAEADRTKRHSILPDQKLIVYDLKVGRPGLPSNYEEEAWNRLKKGIYAINNRERAPESLEILYQLCENLCQYDLADSLFERLQNECRYYVGAEFDKLSRNDSEGVTYLENVNDLWASYCDKMSQIRCIFLYLDRTFAASAAANAGDIWNMAMDQFREGYLTQRAIQDKFVRYLLDSFMSGRNGETVNTQLLHSNIHMLTDLSIYHTNFEEQFLEETTMFYKAECDKLVEEIDISSYLEHVDTRLHQESKQPFDKSSKPAVAAIVAEELLTRRLKDILDKNFCNLMDNSQLDDLSLLYHLLKKIGQLKVCAEYFRDYVKEKGSSILQAHARGRDTVATLLNFQRKTYETVMKSFKDDERFANIFDNRFEHVINSHHNHTKNILAEHIDYVLQKENADENLLEQGMEIFRILHDKDFFEVFYKRDLAKRLLFDLTNRSAEMNMLAKLKKECKLGYSSKLDGMMQDIDKSSKLTQQFKTETAYDSRTMLNINVNVITYGFWPSYTQLDITLPPAFVQLQSMFSDYYRNKLNKEAVKRKLTWLNTLGVCEIDANYPKYKNKLKLTLLQTVVLLCFNDESRSSISFSDIYAITNIAEPELRRALKSLACGQHRLLQKVPPGNDIEQTDEFVFNNEFESDADLIEMVSDKLSEVIESNPLMNQHAPIERRFHMDAAIVRIMKSKQELDHSLLLSEVMCQVRFVASARDVKESIERLIDKGYMERSNGNAYRYVS